MKTELNWFKPGQEMPDDERTVLLYVSNADEPVWPGFHSERRWHWASGEQVKGKVLAWAELPAPPMLDGQAKPT